MKKVLVVTMLLVLSIFTFAETLRVGSFPIPLMVVNQNEGVFVDLTKEIFKRSNLDLIISVATPMKMMNDFAKGDLDVVFPALDVSFANMTEPLKSVEIYTKADFVFTKKGTKLLTSMNDLAGKTIGVTKGYPYVLELLNNQNIKLTYADTDVINARKLIDGRIDAFVVEEKSGLGAFKEAGLSEKMQYSNTTPLSLQKVYYAVKTGSNGNSIVKKISQAILDMKKDGTFGKIMSKAN